jgi:hypothetical protein
VLLPANRHAIETGDDLLDWWNRRRGGALSRIFPLRKPSGSLAAMDCFYDSLDDGCSVMGCLQRARFKMGVDLSEGTRFVAELPAAFARHSTWKRANGDRGGFTYTPVLVQRSGVDAAEVPPSRLVDFDLSGFEWKLFRVDIHDFVRAIPMMRPVARPMSRRVREAALITAVPGLSQPLIPVEDASVAEVAFGYTFLPLAPEPNIFGFGPGHFRSAIKQFHFTLLPDRTLEIRLAFIVAPRSEKILDLRGFDPVYGLVELLDRLSLARIGLSRRCHDRMDAVMLGLHGQVHQNLLEDMAPFWAGGPDR